MVGLAENGELDYNNLRLQLDNTVTVVSFTGASNVTGIVTDIARVRQIIGSDIFLAIDGSQLIPNRCIDIQELNIDALIWTSHKMMGYTGLGIMYLCRSWMIRLTCPWVGGAVIDTVTASSYTLQS